MVEICREYDTGSEGDRHRLAAYVCLETLYRILGRSPLTLTPKDAKGAAKVVDHLGRFVRYPNYGLMPTNSQVPGGWIERWLPRATPTVDNLWQAPTQPSYSSITFTIALHPYPRFPSGCQAKGVVLLFGPGGCPGKGANGMETLQHTPAPDTSNDKRMWIRSPGFRRVRGSLPQDVDAGDQGRPHDLQRDLQVPLGLAHRRPAPLRECHEVQRIHVGGFDGQNVQDWVGLHSGLELAEDLFQDFVEVQNRRRCFFRIRRLSIQRILSCRHQIGDMPCEQVAVQDYSGGPCIRLPARTENCPSGS